MPPMPLKPLLPPGSEEQSNSKKRGVDFVNLRPLVAAMAVAVTGSTAAMWYVTSENTVYYWDYVGWWERSAILYAWLRQSPLLAIKAVLESINSSDYNLLAAVPLAGWIGLGGQSRTWFVLGLITIYGTLSAIAFTLLCSRFPGSMHSATTAEVPKTFLAGFEDTPWPVAMIAPIVWTTWSLPFVVAMRGFVDLGACAITFLVWWLYLTCRSDSWNVRRAIGIGLLLALLFLFRRYWAFWITAFGAVTAVDASIHAWQIRKRDADSWYKPLAVPSLMGLSLLASLLIVAFPLVARTVTTSYGDIYSAYQKGADLGVIGRAVSDLVETIRENGLLATLVGLASLAWLCVCPDTRRIGLLLTAQTLLCYLQFRRVQAPGLQHYLLWCTGLTTATGLCATAITYRLTPKRKWILIASLLAVGTLQMTAAFVPAAKPIRFLMAGNATQLPLVRGDIAELERMVNDIDKEIRDKGAQRIYCAASSPVLNFTTLVGYSPSLGKPFLSAGQLGHTADVDKRDGFPRDLLAADLVIATDPPQTHLDPADQQVVIVPVSQLREQRGIGKAFKLVAGEYQLDGGVKAFLYRRSRPLTIDDVLPLSDALRRCYPDRAYIYEYDHRGP
jgi:hypothetical protein